MKRRKLLKSLGLGLSAGLIMPEMLLSCKKPDPGPEVNFDGTVAIIGAGAAGLYCADILRSKGLKTVIFEAGAKIGGRIKSYYPPLGSDMPTDSFLFVKPDAGTSEDSVADFPLELGPETVSGSNSIWGQIMKDLSFATHNIADGVDQFILDKVAKSAAEWGNDADFLAVQNFMASLPDFTTSGTSVAAAAAVSSRAAALLNAQGGNKFGGTSSEIDAGLLGADLKAAAAKRVASNQDNQQLVLVANRMQDILNTRFINVSQGVKLNTQIKSIDYSGEKIIITDQTSAQTLVEKVVVTVPLSVLKAGTISFNPPLPSDKVGALSRFGMDSCVRVILDFKVNFWDEKLPDQTVINSGFIYGGETTPQFFNGGVGRTDAFRTLTLTTFGPKAAELSALGAGMITPILQEMDEIYAGQATEYVRRNLADDSLILYTIQDWTKEPFINGGYSYPMVGATEADRTALAAPVNDRLFFAGEVMDPEGNAGTVNGALRSAELAAQAVIDSIVL